MSAEQTLFIEPLDVLFLRGNKLFGDAGSYGEALVPPWPSVAAGALRSRLLALDNKVREFASGQFTHPILGTPAEPGSFRVTAFHLARRKGDGQIDLLMPLPADLVITEDDQGKPQARSLNPTAATGVLCSANTPLLPILAETERRKPASGYWLAESGWRNYMAGELPASTDLVKSSALWALDHRVGVGLDTATRRAEDGKLFSTQAVAMTRQGNRIAWNKESQTPVLADYDVGFVATLAGAEPFGDRMVRLGGDGRAAAVHSVDHATPQPDYSTIAQAGRCRVVLTTPGIFANGSTLPGAAADGVFRLGEVRGRLVCAAVPRAEVVSGWDLAHGKPKTAERAVPAGSVYWLDDLQATPQALHNLVNAGLWSEPCEDATRRVEGFNRFTLATWT